MIFSKTFGYALRGILYLALVQPEKTRVQIEEVADRLAVPRHFLGKIFKRLVKEGLLVSVKGPYGGYALAANTLDTQLLRLVELTDGLGNFKNCVLRLQACHEANPCPLHAQVKEVKDRLQTIMKDTTFRSLLNGDKEQFLNSIATYEFGGPIATNEIQ